MKVVLGTRYAKRFRLFLMMAAVMIGSTGCGMKVTLRPPLPETVHGDAIAGGPAYACVLMSTTATVDDKPSLINPAFKDRLLQALRQSNAFTNVYGDDQSISERRKAKVALTIADRSKYNNVLGAIKGFVIGASFFTLSPFIPIYADYTTELRLRVEKPDGSYKQYTGYASGESEHFFFSHGDYYPDLTMQVTDAALRDLSAKLANDRVWLQR